VRDVYADSSNLVDEGLVFTFLLTESSSDFPEDNLGSSVIIDFFLF